MAFHSPIMYRSLLTLLVLGLMPWNAHSMDFHEAEYHDVVIHISVAVDASGTATPWPLGRLDQVYTESFTLPVFNTIKSDPALVSGLVYATAHKKHRMYEPYDGSTCPTSSMYDVIELRFGYNSFKQASKFAALLETSPTDVANAIASIPTTKVPLLPPPLKSFHNSILCSTRTALASKWCPSNHTWSNASPSLRRSEETCNFVDSITAK